MPIGLASRYSFRNSSGSLAMSPQSFPHAHTCHVKTQLMDTHFPTGDGGVMSKFERLLVADSTELPDCRCATEMHLTAIVPVPGGDTEIRIFRCPDCSHELRLTAWRNDVSAT